MELLLLPFVLLVWLVVVVAVLGAPIGLLAVVIEGALRGAAALSRRAAAADRARRRLRASDADRLRVLARLSEQTAVGRLRLDELEERTETAWTARTLGELERLERDLPAGAARARLVRFRPWLVAAAVYNLCWGAGVALGASSPAWKAVGMMVLVYSPAYWWAARNPERHAHFVAIGLLGKMLGPLGFTWAAATGRLPYVFALVILTNDLLWWPAFGAFVRTAARAHGGWKPFLLG